MNASLDLRAENAALREQLDEAQAVLAALHRGEVDALMVGAPGDKKVFTLEGAETPYRVFVEGMAEGAATVDAGGRILYANQSLAQMLKSPLARVIGSQLADAVIPAEREALAEMLAAAATEAGQCEFTLCASDGSELAARMAAAPQRGTPGTTLVALIISDLSDSKRAEAQIHALNANLEARVEQRTAELARMNEEMQSFSYSVSHDLRAPLRSIDGFSRMLEEDYAPQLDDEGKDALHRVRANAQKMSVLIDDLLKLSRLSRYDLNAEAVDLAEIARSIAAALQAAEPARRVSFDIVASAPAQGDRRLLSVVLENLIGNAWKFSSKHATAKITMGTGSVEGAPMYFVRDDGAGFDMAYVGNLFAPFQRLHGTEEFPGTGIGLSIVRRIVQRHGGRVWAEGAVEKGATFYFTLPPPAADSLKERSES